MVSAKFSIGREEKVATAGSCFAQHIALKLQAMGFNYFVAEQAEGVPAEIARSRGYGVFSARYGNIYTVPQLLQLFLRAHGNFNPLEDHWIRPDGRFADPYRPNVEAGGFESLQSLRDDRASHLEKVRTMFRETDVFVFTLGLTEGWRSRRDGAVFPLAPGVTAGEYDETVHEFVNFDVAQTVEDMHAFLSLLREVNKRIRVLLTVSPVPLIATYENQHVLTATTYSKAVLRVAAESITRALDWVDYFPSFEIITGSFNGGAYYEPDAREVTDTGVAHVMRCFAKHYLEGQSTGQSAPGEIGQASPGVDGPVPTASAVDIVCDEEAIDQVRD